MTFPAITSNNNILKRISKSKPTNSNVNQQKRKLLYWGDSVFATTGFGVVGNYIMKALHNTGLYDIDHLAVNHSGEFYDKEKYPYSIIPARLQNPKDVFGKQMFVNSLLQKDYDIVFIHNDIYVVEDIADKVEEIRELKKKQGKKPFKVIYYYPIDCHFADHASGMCKVADINATYTSYGKDETFKVMKPENFNVVYLGSSPDKFYKINDDLKIQQFRENNLGIKDPNTFLWINVNRNGLRKDMARTLLAFSEFRKKVPNSKLYMHCRIIDGTQGILNDLSVPLKELGLNPVQDVIFPHQKRFKVVKGYPPHILNMFYNAANGFITTTLGEGFGMTLFDAMCAKVPIVGPENTSLIELIGKDRGYLYPCKEKVFFENSGFRPMGHLNDIVSTMMTCYKDWRDIQNGIGSKRANLQKQKIESAWQFANQYTWDKICKQWVDLCDAAYNLNVEQKQQSINSEVI